MAIDRLVGKYVPDKNGKLRHTLNFMGTNANTHIPTPTRYNYSFIISATESWYKRVWFWVKQSIK